MVTVQPCKELCQLSCAWRWGGGTHISSWDREAHGDLRRFFQFGYTKMAMLKQCVLIKVRCQPAACQMPSINISDQDLPQFLGGEVVFQLLS